MRRRRPPPRFRVLSVDRARHLTPHMVRVTLVGAELEGLVVDQPASSVRLVVPSPGADSLIVPEWTGNEFLLPDGSRPALRTFTPRRLDHDAGELDIDIVVHDGGVLSAWATSAAHGDQVAVSGTARGYDVDPEAEHFLLLGDETAIPAISQLVEAIADHVEVEITIEIAHAEARLALPAHGSLTERWHVLGRNQTRGEALLAALRSAEFGDGVRVWAAGEAAAMQRLRRFLFDEIGMDRRSATVRGYWKQRDPGVDGPGDPADED